MEKITSKLQYKCESNINHKWGTYDILVATCHLDNYGCIFVDESNTPIDNEYDLEEIALQMGL